MTPADVHRSRIPGSAPRARGGDPRGARGSKCRKHCPPRARGVIPKRRRQRGAKAAVPRARGLILIVGNHQERKQSALRADAGVRPSRSSPPPSPYMPWQSESGEALKPHRWAFVPQVVVLVLTNLLVPDALVIVRVRRDPLVRAVAVVELLIFWPQDAHRSHPRKR